MIQAFPPLESADQDGLLAIGGDLEIPSLKLAYESGIFPWPTEGLPLLWFAPPRRAVLEFKNLKVSPRLKRELKKKDFHFKVDRNFPAVIKACAKGLTRDSTGTWITPEMIRAYIDFHRAGYAHSFECYNAAKQLVGGMYGVSFGGMFAGESMFYLESGASKATLLYACAYLQEHGGRWMDVQTMSPLLKTLGAKLIPRQEYMKKLKAALRDPSIFGSGGKADPTNN